MPNFVNLYFAICLIAWIIDVIAFVAIVTVKPLRKWCWNKYWDLTRLFCKKINDVSWELINDKFSDE